MLKLKNTQPGPRGVNALSGPVLVDPGQTVEVEVYEREKEHLEATGWFDVKGSWKPNPDAAAAPVAAVDDALKAKDAEIAELRKQLAAKSGGEPAGGTYSVKDKGRGWYAIIDKDGAEVTKSLREDDVKDFDSLSDEDKAAFVDLNKPE